MPYNSVIDRSGAEGLIPVDESKDIIQGIPQFSTVMQLATRLPDMSRRQRSMPIVSNLPVAYFVNGDTGLKQTSSMGWEKLEIVAEELAVIVPIPDAVMDDADYDIWGQIKPWIQAAFGKAFDQAVFYNTNAPTSWPGGILAGAIAAGQTVDYSTRIGAGANLYDILLAESGILSLLEEDGFMADGHVAALSMRAKLRGVKDDQDRPIFVSDPLQKSAYMLDGETLLFPKNGAIDPAQSLLVSGAWKQGLVYALRQDLTYKVLDQAVITDNTGTIVVNLAQQDMTALRCVMRLGYQIANPPNQVNENAATRYPFAVLVP